MRNPIPPLFGIEKVHKRFSPLKRRSESAAHLRSFKSSLADAPRCSMGLVSMHKLVDIILALMPCHVTVCVNFILGAKSNFLKLLRSQQDTLLRPACLSARNLDQILLLCIEKLCAKFYTMYRVIFLY